MTIFKDEIDAAGKELEELRDRASVYDEVPKAVAELGAEIAAQNAAIGQLAQAITQLTEIVAAGREVIRDESGRVSGSRLRTN